nr:hypothetical protein CFP56_48772 [Quercus suber]
MKFHLPIEILWHIYSFVDVSDKATCAAICATNTFGRDTMRPILYTTIDGGASYGDEDRIDVFDRGRRLSLLCRTLVENSDLAGLVEQFIHWLDSQTLAERGAGSIESRYVYGVTDVQYDALSFRLSDVSLLPLLQFWKSLNQDRRCAESRHIILILLICPKLVKCAFRGTTRITEKMPWFNWLLGIMGSSKIECRSLCQLREFSLENRTEEIRAPNITTIDAMLRLPDLRTIRFTDMGRVNLGSMKTQASTNVEHLDFEGTQMSTSRLLRRLSLCPRLCVLTLGGLRLYGGGWKELGDVLRTCCPLLRTVRLTPNACWGETSFFSLAITDACHSTSVTGTEYLGSLQPFKHLKHLEVSKANFCGFISPNRRWTVLSSCTYEYDALPMKELLPTSLEHFVISCYVENRDAVEEALQSDPFITNLQHFSIVTEL